MTSAQMPRERITLEPAFVLHAREYRDTSRILDVFSATHGRLTLFARGARGPKSKLASLVGDDRLGRVAVGRREPGHQLHSLEPLERRPDGSHPALAALVAPEQVDGAGAGGGADRELGELRSLGVRP